MTRNPELIRGILLDIEPQMAPVQSGQLTYDYLNPIPTPEQVAGHMALLGDAGYAEVETQLDHNGMISDAVILRLTNQGHDFLNSIRDDGIWVEVKGHFKNAMGSVTLELMKTAAVGYLKKKYHLT